MSFSENIKKYRTINNMTQQELADKLNISRTTISKFENNKADPAIDILIRISEIFNISIDELLGIK